MGYGISIRIAGRLKGPGTVAPTLESLRLDGLEPRRSFHMESPARPPGR
jgi:hypothetical protein